MFSTHVEANHVQKTEDVYAAYKLTDEDKEAIHLMAADKRIGVCPMVHKCTGAPGLRLRSSAWLEAPLNPTRRATRYII